MRDFASIGIMFACIVYCLTIYAGCAYIVFWRGESGWWFCLAVLLSAVSPQKYILAAHGIQMTEDDK